MYYLRLTVCLSIFFFCFFDTNAQISVSNLQAEIYKKYENLDIQTAKKLLQQKPQKQSFDIILENYADVLELLCSENEILYTKLNSNEKKRIEKLELFSKEVSYLFCKAEIKLQWAFIHLQYGHEWRAFQNIRQAFKLLKESEKLHPNFLPTQRSLGLLYSLLSSVPENYQWALSLFGLEGDENKGIAYLQKVAQSNDFYAKETQLLLALTQTFILKQQDEAIKTVEIYELDKKMLNENANLLRSFVISWIFLKTGNAKKILTHNLISEQIPHPSPQTTQRCDMPLRLYVYAEACLLTNNLQNAQKYYISYLTHLRGSLYLKDAYYKLLLISYLQKDMDKVQSYQALISTKGTTKTAADRYAMRFAEKKQLPNQELLVVRLLTDGGEYATATTYFYQIDSNRLKKNVEKVEYYYRIARILHKQKQYLSALQYYQIVLSKPATETYFAPNAALQMAWIYANDRKDTSKAKKYAQMVENYQNYDYENSIRMEAKKILRKL
jgi:hypothetical protein